MKRRAEDTVKQEQAQVGVYCGQPRSRASGSGFVMGDSAPSALATHSSARILSSLSGNGAVSSYTSGPPKATERNENLTGNIQYSSTSYSANIPGSCVSTAVKVHGCLSTSASPVVSSTVTSTAHQFQRLKVEDALSYLDQVKFKFGNQPQVYNDFLDIMKEFKSQSIDTPGVIQRVSNLFKGHPELIVGFNTFLPPGYKIEVQSSDQGHSFQVSVSMPSPSSVTAVPTHVAAGMVTHHLSIPANLNTSVAAGAIPATATQSSPVATGIVKPIHRLVLYLALGWPKSKSGTNNYGNRSRGMGHRWLKLLQNNCKKDMEKLYEGGCEGRSTWKGKLQSTEGGKAWKMGTNDTVKPDGDSVALGMYLNAHRADGCGSMAEVNAGTLEIEGADVDAGSESYKEETVAVLSGSGLPCYRSVRGLIQGRTEVECCWPRVLVPCKKQEAVAVTKDKTWGISSMLRMDNWELHMLVQKVTVKVFVTYDSRCHKDIGLEKSLLPIDVRLNLAVTMEPMQAFEPKNLHHQLICLTPIRLGCLYTTGMRGVAGLPGKRTIHHTCPLPPLSLEPCFSPCCPLLALLPASRLAAHFSPCCPLLAIINPFNHTRTSYDSHAGFRIKDHLRLACNSFTGLEITDQQFIFCDKLQFQLLKLSCKAHDKQEIRIRVPLVIVRNTVTFPQLSSFCIFGTEYIELHIRSSGLSIVVCLELICKVHTHLFVQLSLLQQHLVDRTLIYSSSTLLGTRRYHQLVPSVQSQSCLVTDFAMKRCIGLSYEVPFHMPHLLRALGCFLLLHLHTCVRWGLDVASVVNLLVQHDKSVLVHNTHFNAFHALRILKILAMTVCSHLRGRFFRDVLQTDMCKSTSCTECLAGSPLTYPSPAHVSAEHFKTSGPYFSSCERLVRTKYRSSVLNSDVTKLQLPSGLNGVNAITLSYCSITLEDGTETGHKIIKICNLDRKYILIFTFDIYPQNVLSHQPKMYLLVSCSVHYYLYDASIVSQKIASFMPVISSLKLTWRDLDYRCFFSSNHWSAARGPARHGQLPIIVTVKNVKDLATNLDALFSVLQQGNLKLGQDTDFELHWRFVSTQTQRPRPLPPICEWMPQQPPTSHHWHPEIQAYWHCPETVVADIALQFTSAEFHHFCEENGIILVRAFKIQMTKLHQHHCLDDAITLLLVPYPSIPQDGSSLADKLHGQPQCSQFSIIHSTTHTSPHWHPHCCHHTLQDDVQAASIGRRGVMLRYVGVHSPPAWQYCSTTYLFLIFSLLSSLNAIYPDCNNTTSCIQIECLDQHQRSCLIFICMTSFFVVPLNIETNHDWKILEHIVSPIVLGSKFMTFINSFAALCEVKILAPESNLLGYSNTLRDKERGDITFRLSLVCCQEHWDNNHSKIIEGIEGYALKSKEENFEKELHLVACDYIPLFTLSMFLQDFISKRQTVPSKAINVSTLTESCCNIFPLRSSLCALIGEIALKILYVITTWTVLSLLKDRCCLFLYSPTHHSAAAVASASAVYHNVASVTAAATSIPAVASTPSPSPMVPHHHIAPSTSPVPAAAGYTSPAHSISHADHCMPQGQGQPVEFNHAINYVNKIKNRFQGQPDKYKKFLEILHTYQKEQRNMKEGHLPPGKHLTEAEVYSQVAKLFEHQDDLLAEFGQFLPDATSHQAALGARLSSGEHSTVLKRSSGPKPGYSSNSCSGRDSSLSALDQRAGMGSSKFGHSSGQIKRTSSLSSSVSGSGVSGTQSKKHKLATLRDITITEAGKYSTLSDFAFFDKVRKALKNTEAYENFLRCLTLFNNEIVSSSELIQLVTPFLGKFPELFKWFKRFMGRSGNLYQLPSSSHNNASENSHSNGHHPDRMIESLEEIDYTTCKRLGASYCALPKNYRQPKCSGRTPLCKEVLNDTWVSFPSWSEDSTFVTSRKTQYEEFIYRCEDERFELDLVIETNTATIRVLEGVNKKMSRMSHEELVRFKLDDCLGGSSPTIHLRAVRRLYGDKAPDIIEGLKKNPTVAVPVVLRRLKSKEEEWREAQKGFNKVWREQNEKYYLKSLDHQGINFKQNDLKALRSKSLFNDIEVIFDERHEQAEETTADVSTGPHLILPYKNKCILDDTANLLIHHVKRQTGIHKEEKHQIKLLLRQLVPDMFFHPRQELSEDEREEEEKTDGSKENASSNAEQSCRNISSEDLNDQEVPDIKKSDVNLPHHAKSSHPGESYTLFYANNYWYLFLRLHQILCERLTRMYERARFLAAEECMYRRDRRESTAVALRLKPKSEIEVEDYYPAFLDMIKNVLDGNMDNSTFEDHLREMFGIFGYLSFTIDKVIISAVRQLQFLVTDETCRECIDLYHQEKKHGGAGGDCKTAYLRIPAEQSYQRKAEKLLLKENCFKVVIYKHDCQLTIELLDTEENSRSEAEPDEKWPAFGEGYSASAADGVGGSQTSATVTASEIRDRDDDRMDLSAEDNDELESEIGSAQRRKPVFLPRNVRMWRQRSGHLGMLTDYSEDRMGDRKYICELEDKQEIDENQEDSERKNSESSSDEEEEDTNIVSSTNQEEETLMNATEVRAADSTFCNFNINQYRMVFVVNQENYLYRRKAFHRAHQLHSSISLRLGIKFRRWHVSWVAANVSEMQHRACEDWLMGRGESFVPNRTHVVTINDVNSPPYRSYNRYRVERLSAPSGSSEE
ncbi:uncharacterized protein LOC126297921 [Schistocerca gregaria]|uniref:uncharacterized protein LOC126297921 n=1 Tax=Schistocerca gregaria TaxID=7010 RepID=UPI00211E207D|nr:uncharacterized protein LOC126297921 [Schistocerca gregaria]